MHPAGRLPDDILEAISDGWSGVTIVTPRAGGDPVLVCAAPVHQLASLQGGGLSLDLPRGSSGAGSRALRIGLEPLAGHAGPPVGMVLDLGYAEGRRLVAQITDGGGLDLMWIASEPPYPASLERVRLDGTEARALARAVARAGEWHVATPLPLGLDGDAWRRAARDAPALVATGRAEGEVVLAVPEATLAGLGGRHGRVCFSAPGQGRSGSRELLVRFLWDSDGGGALRDVQLDLGCAATRSLAARLGLQRSLLVIGAGRRATPGPCVRVTLTAPARALLASLGDGAAPPPAGCPRRLRPGP